MRPTESKVPSARTLQAEETRERILTAALDLIAERGYAATSIDALCRRAGVVRTAIYWHFGSKDGLVVPVVERVAATWIEEIQKAVYLEGDPLTRLDRFVAGLRELVARRSALLRLPLAVALERGEVNQSAAASLRTLSERARAAIVQGVEDSTGASRADAELIARMALAYVHLAVAQQLADPRPEATESVFADLRTAILLVLGARLREGKEPRGRSPAGGSA